MIDDSIIASLKQKHGDELHQLGDGLDALVVRPPSRAAWKRFRASVQDGGVKRLEAAERLVLDCLVWPEADKADAIFDRRPALVDIYAAQLSVLAGADEEAAAKKL